MKQKLLLTGIIFVILSCNDNNSKTENENTNASGKNETSSSNSESSSSSKPANALFEIKAVKIVFTHTGGPEEGTETLYFDDYGAVAVLVVDKKSKYTVNKQTIIWKDKKSTVINHENKNVASSSFRSKDTEPPSLADTDDNTKKSIGYEKLADETIAGKTCEVWFNAKQNFKYCIWKKISLKEVLGNGFHKEAISVEEISEIPASVMEIPKDYER